MRLLTPLLLSAISASVLADDTEVYTGNGAGTDANIMFILDTSESMSTLANPTEVTAYDPDVVYDNSRFGFEPDSLYVYNAPVYELDFPQVDDVVGAIPVHLFAGVWGTLAVALFGNPDLLGTNLSL